MSRVQRYAGESLGDRPHIVVLGSCKVGNFVVSTPALRGLRQRFPNAVIGFLGSEVTADFELALPEVDWRVSWDSSGANAAFHLHQFLLERRQRHGEVDLAVNLDGFNPVTCTLVPWLSPRFVAGGSLRANLRGTLPWGSNPRQSFLADSDWDSCSFLERYHGLFTSNYIAELFCHVAFVSDYVDSRQIMLPSVKPPFEVPDLLIHCTTARAAKIWPFDRWALVVRTVAKWGWRVGLVGSPPSAQKEAYNSGEGEEWLLASTPLQDLRGRTSLIELAGACLEARAVVSVDAGPLHIAAAVGTPTFAVVGNDKNGVGASPIRLWLPRVSNCTRSESTHTCDRCSLERFRNDDCLVDGHPCMAGVEPEQIITWLQTINGSKNANYR